MKPEDQSLTEAAIGKYLENNASEAEIQKLADWVKASPENLKYYRQVKNIWEVSGKLQEDLDISVEQALQKVTGKFKAEVKSVTFWQTMQKVAAILLLPLMVGSYFLGNFIRGPVGTPSRQIVYNEVFAAYGTRSAITLADGSKVWLNSGSALKYPDRFLRGKREVFLDGEAYFEVKSDTHQPFLVHTDKITVKATGTKFNVLATKLEPHVEITLISGKVTVSDLNDGKQGRLISRMQPDEHLEYDTLTHRINLIKGETYKYYAWKDGKLIFRNEPLVEVMEKISRFYNVDIEIRGDKLREYRYRATFKEESFTEILKLLKLSSPIEYREIVRSPLPDGTFPKRKVIIYAKNHSLK